MNDKERLEKIKEKVNSLLYLGDSEGNGEVNINAIYNDMSWLISQAEKTERYEKALREIANEQEVGEGDFNAADVANNLIATAKEALEGAE